MSDTPGVAAKKGFICSCAIFFNSIEERLLSKLKPITGKIEGFIFSTVICVPGSKLPLTLFISDSICKRARSILASHFKKTEISQLPLAVVLRI